MSNILNTKLKFCDMFNHIFPDAIIAFRPGVSSADSIREIQDFKDALLHLKQPAAALQIDIQSAYDAVCRRYVYCLLLKMNIPGSFINKLKFFLKIT